MNTCEVRIEEMISRFLNRQLTTRVVILVILSGCGHGDGDSLQTLDVLAQGIPIGERVQIGVNETEFIDVTSNSVSQHALAFDAHVSELAVVKAPALTKCDIVSKKQRRNTGRLEVMCTSRIPQFQPLVSLDTVPDRGQVQNIYWIGALGETALFALADSRRNSSDLWRSDGTPAGTFPLTSNSIGEYVSSPGLSLGDYSVIQRISYQSEGSPSIWRSDGTQAGTYELDNAIGLPEGGYSNPVLFGDGALWFFRESASGICHLKYYDGSVVRSLDSVVNIFDLFLVADNSAVIFVVNPSADEVVFKRMDSSGLTLSDVEGFISWFGAPSIFGQSNGEYLFVNVFPRNELWITDGTREKTRKIAHNAFSRLVDTPNGVGAKRGVTDDSFFVASDSEARVYGLFKTDGTESGTSRLGQVVFDGDPNRKPLFRVNGGLYFVGSDGAAFSPFVYRRGTLTKIRQFEANGRIDEFVGMGGLTYFRAYDESFGSDSLWISDDTEKGTRAIASQIAFVRSLLATEKNVFVLASERDGGRKVWVSVDAE